MSSPAVYGPNVSALATYLLICQHIPVAHTAELIGQLCGLDVSTSWVCRALRITAEALVEAEHGIKTLIMLAHLLHVDETSTNISGARWWLRVAATQKLIAYFLHRSRGRAAVNAFAILPRFTGTAAHDALSVYDAYPATHALCGAHLIRELTAAAETHPDQAWPDAARDALHTVVVTDSGVEILSEAL